MNLSRDYHLFATIVAEGSLSGAARVLHLSPAMVSKRLARMEDHLGAQLIRRTTRRLELTERGLRFHKDVLAILAAVLEAEARLSGHSKEPSGPLRISAPTSFGRLQVVPILAPFLDQFPNVEVELNLSDDFNDLLGERIDLAIRITATVEAGYESERLADVRRILCAAPAYLATYGEPKSIADLANHRLLAARGQFPWRLVAPNRPIKFEGQSVITTNSSEAVREMALAGGGIALRSLWDIGGDLVAGRLARVLPDYRGAPEVGIYAVQPRGSLASASAFEFINRLRASFQPVPPWEQ